MTINSSQTKNVPLLIRHMVLRSGAGFDKDNNDANQGK
ncbi:hypothetical protein [Enterobacter hormaechei]|nr:hypothetical protein [Enterobacter hormaechei]